MNHFWIRKGTNNFTYEFLNDDLSVTTSLSRGDQFYDAIVDYEIEGGLHVVEYESYKKDLKEFLTYKLAMHFLRENHPEIYKTISYKFFARASKLSIPPKE